MTHQRGDVDSDLVLFQMGTVTVEVGPMPGAPVAAMAHAFTEKGLAERSSREG